uniref:Sulfotransferase n=2 Tax=Latimeria chalumnae TaxID=7897 RepID=M3XGW3_LATCH
MRTKKPKVIYVARNPKDLLVSYYHFHSFCRVLEIPQSFDEFLDKFLSGAVYCSSWFDHIKEWYSHKDEFDFLYITYEEMIKDLRASVIKISNFVGKKLDDETLGIIVDQCTFKNMKSNSAANYEMITNCLDHNKGVFLRKGTIGDWKNNFTVAQNEKFNKVFQEKMKDFPLPCTWEADE